MKDKGFATPILFILLTIVFLMLAGGSYLYLKDRQPAPQSQNQMGQVTIDKSKYIPGRLLVTFKSGTSYSTAESIFQKHQITEYTHLGASSRTEILNSTDIFQVGISQGTEQDMINTLLNESSVSTATLQYVQ